mgnify:CR=1 FL=1
MILVELDRIVGQVVLVDVSVFARSPEVYQSHLRVLVEVTVSHHHVVWFYVRMNVPHIMENF